MSHSLIVSTDLTDVTLASEDTSWRLYRCGSGKSKVVTLIDYNESDDDCGESALVMTMVVMMKMIVMTMMMIIISNRVSQEVGRTVYTLMLNQAGGIEADLTITRFFSSLHHYITSLDCITLHHYITLHYRNTLNTYNYKVFHHYFHHHHHPGWRHWNYWENSFPRLGVDPFSLSLTFVTYSIIIKSMMWNILQTWCWSVLLGYWCSSSSTCDYLASKTPSKGSPRCSWWQWW